MVKKIKLLCSSSLIFIIFLCFSVSSLADTSISVSLTSSSHVSGSGSYSSTKPSNSVPYVWDALESAWGSPVGYVSFDCSDSSGGQYKFTFTASSTPDYWIVPRYDVTYHIADGTTATAHYANYSLVSASDWVLVDSASTNTISYMGEDITFSYDLYKANYTSVSNPSVYESRLTFGGSNSGYFLDYNFSLPVFLPQAFKGSGGGDVSGGGGSDLDQWNAVITRIDRVNEYLESVDNTLDGINNYIKYPDADTTSKVNDVLTKVEEVSIQVDQAIKDMSIPPVDVTVNNVNFGNGLSTVAKIQNSLLMHPLLLPIVTVGVSCWVIKLLLFGNK